jgi:hypothetical protein
MKNITINTDEITNRREPEGKIIIESSRPLEGIIPLKSKNVKVGRFYKEEKRFYTVFFSPREFEFYLGKYELKNVTGISHLPAEVSLA